MKYLQNKYLKIVIAVLIIAWAVYQFTQGNIGNGIALILLSLIPILLYFRNEFILLTFLRLRKQDFAGMEKWLGKIADPQTALLRKQLGLTMSYDVAMAKLSLAGIMMQKRKKREAQELLTEAKKLDKQNLMSDQIKMMQQQLKKI